jgi:hypothetical protein
MRDGSMDDARAKTAKLKEVQGNNAGVTSTNESSEDGDIARRSERVRAFKGNLVLQESRVCKRHQWKAVFDYLFNEWEGAERSTESTAKKPQMTWLELSE